MAQSKIDSRRVEELGISTDLHRLNLLIDRHPWFITGRIIKQVVTGEKDDLLAMHLSAYPAPKVMLEEINSDLFLGEERENRGGDSSSREKNEQADRIITKFLKEKKLRIKPRDDTTKDDMSIKSGELDITGELISEELAQIYTAQGLTEQAEEIYRKLKEREKPSSHSSIKTKL